MDEVTRLHVDYDGEQCTYCKQHFPFPVSLHHSEDECESNIKAFRIGQ